MMPRGVDYRIPLSELRAAADEHAAGFSLRSIADRHWQRWGYASPKSALEGLRHALRSIDAPVRDRLEAVVLASTVHGNGRRAMQAAGDPAYRAHRRRLRRQARIRDGLLVRPPATPAELAECRERRERLA
jgi:hypothetical protein